MTWAQLLTPSTTAPSVPSTTTSKEDSLVKKQPSATPPSMDDNKTSLATETPTDSVVPPAPVVVVAQEKPITAPTPIPAKVCFCQSMHVIHSLTHSHTKKIVNVPARSENVQSSSSSNNAVGKGQKGSGVAKLAEASWPDLAVAAAEESKAVSENTPQPLVASTGNTGKAKKWSRLPVQIRFASANDSKPSSSSSNKDHKDKDNKDNSSQAKDSTPATTQKRDGKKSKAHRKKETASSANAPPAQGSTETSKDSLASPSVTLTLASSNNNTSTSTVPNVKLTKRSSKAPQQTTLEGGPSTKSAPASPLRHNLPINTSVASHHHHARSASSATTTTATPPPPMVARSSSSSYGGNSSYRKSYPRSNNSNNNGHSSRDNGAPPPSMSRGSSSKGYSSRDNNNTSTSAYPSSSYYYSYYPPFPSAVPVDFGYPPSTQTQPSGPQQQQQQTAPLELIQSWIQGQVEYYFSVENLCRDLYFKQQMDPRHGGVPMTLIAGFNRVKSLLNMARPFCPALLSGPAKEDTKVSQSEAVESWLVNDLLELCISASETIHVFKPAQGAPSSVGLRQGWDYWVVRPSLSTPTATTSAAPQSSHQPPQSHSTPSTTESLGNSGNGLEETRTGHRVSSSMPLSSSSVPKKYQHDKLQQDYSARSIEEAEQSMPTPPISPHIARI